MTEVVPYTRAPAEARLPLALRGSDLEVAAQYANAVAGTDFVPKGLRNNPAAIAAAILYGDEVGLEPMQSLAKIAVIDGRPSLSAEAQRALILAAGHDIWIEELTVSKCTMAGRRRDGDATSRITWTLDDARRANLAGKVNWRLYPRQMLLARASAELARAIFPDAIGGLAATEELEDVEPADNGDTNTGAKKASTTRRRRRASVTAREPKPAEPAAGDEPEPGGLPPDEEAVVQALERELGAEAHRPEPEPEPELATESQRRKLHALFRERGIEDRQERLDYCTANLGRPIATSTEITKDEASWLIDRLDQPTATEGEEAT